MVRDGRWLNDPILFKGAWNAIEDPSAYTNRLETIAGVKLVKPTQPWNMDGEDGLRYQKALEQAMKQAAPFIERAGKSSEHLE